MNIRTQNIGRGINARGENIGEYPTSTVPSASKGTRGGQEESKAVPLAAGSHWIEGIGESQYYTIPCDALTVLELQAISAGYGYLIVKTPDGRYTFLDLTDARQEVSLLCEVSGDYLLRFIDAPGTEGFELSIALQEPLHIAYTLTEKYATAEGEAESLVAGDIRDYDLCPSRNGRQSLVRKTE